MTLIWPFRGGMAGSCKIVPESGQALFDVMLCGVQVESVEDVVAVEYHFAVEPEHRSEGGVGAPPRVVNGGGAPGCEALPPLGEFPVGAHGENELAIKRAADEVDVEEFAGLPFGADEGAANKLRGILVHGAPSKWAGKGRVSAHESFVGTFEDALGDAGHELGGGADREHVVVDGLVEDGACRAWLIRLCDQHAEEAVEVAVEVIQKGVAAADGVGAVDGGVVANVVVAHADIEGAVGIDPLDRLLLGDLVDRFGSREEPVRCVEHGAQVFERCPAGDDADLPLNLRGAAFWDRTGMERDGCEVVSISVNVMRHGWAPFTGGWYGIIEV